MRILRAHLTGLSTSMYLCRWGFALPAMDWSTTMLGCCMIAYIQYIHVHTQINHENCQTVKPHTQEHRLKQSFLALLNQFDMAQLVMEPTHIQGNTLDLLCTNDSQVVHDVEVIYPGLSDHCIIQATIDAKMQVTKKPLHTVKQYHKADSDKFSDEMWRLKHDLANIDVC